MTTASKKESVSVKRKSKIWKFFEIFSKKSGDKLIKGAFALSLGSVLTKFLGAFYRVPLTSVLGAEGLGIYQTVFPIYCILLTFSSTGVPTAISKLIASGYDERETLKKSLFLFVPLGLLGSLAMVIFSRILSNLQASPNAYLSYIALSPSVVAVSVISCLRGYFQGKMNMIPTAVSQITEQAVKLIFGLFLCSNFGSTAFEKGALASLAVSLSEIIALIYLLSYKRKRKTSFENCQKIAFKRLIATLLPITLSSLTLPLSRALDSFTVVNFLSKYTPLATNLYGVYMGSVEAVANVPIAVCYALATAVLPSLARTFSQNNADKVKSTIINSFSLTLFISTLSGLVLFLFSPLIINVLFRSLQFYEKQVATKLLSLCFFTVIGLSLVQTLNSCLIAINRPYAPCVFLSIGVLIKLFLQIFLLQIPKINIFGCLYSDIACYFVAVFLNLLYIKYITSKNIGEITNENNFSRSGQ